MVLASFGLNQSEDELRELCDCTIFGTSAIALIRTARALGLTASRKYSLTLAELREFTGQGYFPIVFVVLLADSLSPDVHALVVISVSAEEIAVFDPQQGPQQLSLEVFSEMWSPKISPSSLLVRAFDTQTRAGLLPAEFLFITLLESLFDPVFGLFLRVVNIRASQHGFVLRDGFAAFAREVIHLSGAEQ